MKQFFFVLVFLNVVYFFWGLTTGDTTTIVKRQAPLYEENKLETLLLISEDEIAALLEKQLRLEKEAEKYAELLIRECYLVGGFANEAEAEVLSNALSDLAQTVSVISSEVTEEFWVIYPSNGDWNRSLLNVEQLKAKGVADLWLVPTGQYRGVISLGLFLTEESADKRLKELSDKLVDADVITREKYRYGVKLIPKNGIEAIQSYLDNVKIDKDISIRKIAC